MLAAPVRFLTGAFFIVPIINFRDNERLCYRQKNLPVVEWTRMAFQKARTFLMETLLLRLGKRGLIGGW